MNGAYVLENKKGQVVRYLSWEADRAYVVYLTNTRRIQPVAHLTDLDAEEIEYTLLAEVSKTEVKKAPVKIANVGYLRYSPEVTNVIPSIELPEENPEDLKRAVKWSSGVAVAILVFLLIGSIFIKPKQEEEQNVVTIMPREEVQKMIVPRTPHVKQNTVAQKPLRKPVKSPIAQIKKVTRPSTTHQASLNNMGALAVLGSMKNSPDRGGLKVDAVNTTRGPGLGGTAGSGGIQTSMYGKGLISAPMGPGANAKGAGGYGNHGAGGGRAGYGKIGLTGSSTAYFEPIQSDAIIEGGLDRAQIAEVIQRHIGQVRYCYEQGLQSAPVMNGRVAIKFVISAGGDVTVANVTSSSLHSQGVESCIVDRLKGWKFPRPRGGVVVKVNYPFVLKRVSQG